jgi:hypothetical protein
MPKQPNAGERPVAFHRPRRDVARMTVRLHHQRMSIASFLALLCDAVRPADQKPWLDYADIKKRPDPEYGHAYPQSALPGSCKSVEQRARNAGWSTKRMSGCTMTRPTAMMESWRPRGHNWCAAFCLCPKPKAYWQGCAQAWLSVRVRLRLRGRVRRHRRSPPLGALHHDRERLVEPEIQLPKNIDQERSIVCTA